MEAQKSNRMFTARPSKVNSQWEASKMTTDPPTYETELYWNGIWEKEASYNTNVERFVDLRTTAIFLYKI